MVSATTPSVAVDRIKRPLSSEAAQVKVITPDVGGGFGAKISCDPEESILGVLAAKVGRPLRWRGFDATGETGGTLAFTLQ